VLEFLDRQLVQRRDTCLETPGSRYVASARKRTRERSDLAGRARCVFTRGNGQPFHERCRDVGRHLQPDEVVDDEAVEQTR